LPKLLAAAVSRLRTFKEVLADSNVVHVLSTLQVPYLVLGVAIECVSTVFSEGVIYSRATCQTVSARLLQGLYVDCQYFLRIFVQNTSVPALKKMRNFIEAFGAQSLLAWPPVVFLAEALEWVCINLNQQGQVFKRALM
jgi:predicted glycosyltransferase involved in capsule biosynthesis